MIRMRALSTFATTLYSPVRRLKQLVRSPLLVAPDVTTLDICWQQIFKDRIYRHDAFRIPESGAVLMDVGANVGVFAAWAARHYRPARILCFEPDPITYPYLVKNAATIERSEGATRIQHFQLALSAEDGGKLTLYHAPKLSGGSTMMAVGKEFGWTSFEVLVTTISRQLRDLAIPAVDLLKIDVEGHAAEVLRGIEDGDWARIRNIALECDYVPEGSTTVESMRGFLSERGYRTDVDDASLSNNATVYAWRD